jgi:hypothetical protein
MSYFGSRDASYQDDRVEVDQDVQSDPTHRPSRFSPPNAVGRSQYYGSAGHRWRDPAAFAASTTHRQQCDGARHSYNNTQDGLHLNRLSAFEAGEISQDHTSSHYPTRQQWDHPTENAGTNNLLYASGLESTGSENNPSDISHAHPMRHQSRVDSFEMSNYPYGAASQLTNTAPLSPLDNVFSQQQWVGQSHIQPPSFSLHPHSSTKEGATHQSEMPYSQKLSAPKPDLPTVPQVLSGTTTQSGIQSGVPSGRSQPLRPNPLNVTTVHNPPVSSVFNRTYAIPPPNWDTSKSSPLTLSQVGSNQYHERNNVHTTKPSDAQERTQFVNPTELYLEFQECSNATEESLQPRSTSGVNIEPHSATHIEPKVRSNSQLQLEQNAKTEKKKATARKHQSTTKSLQKGSGDVSQHLQSEKESADTTSRSNTITNDVSSNTSIGSSTAAQAKIPPSNQTPQPSESFEDMASEMRNMLEKLRGWRSKDPGLFSMLWDEFRKVCISFCDDLPFPSFPVTYFISGPVTIATNIPVATTTSITATTSITTTTSIATTTPITTTAIATTTPIATTNSIATARRPTVAVFYSPG